MSTSESDRVTTAPFAQVPMKTAGIVSWLLAVALTAVGTFFDVTGNDTGTDEDNELGWWVGMMVVLAVIAYVVYRYWYGPADTSPDASNAALVGGIVAAVTFVVFWTGLPAVFGVGAVLLGLRAGTAKATAGAALGALAVVAAVVLAIVG